MNRYQPKDYLDIPLGKHQIHISKKYQFLYTLNDFLISIWFLIGSICFLFDNYQKIGTWLFILGSFQLLIRPLIRIMHEVHIKRIDKRN